MAVTVQNTLNQSVANGATTVFPYQFKIVDAADLLVKWDSVVKVLNTHYTVTGAGADGGGDVTFLPGFTPPAGTVVVRKRDMQFDRSKEYQTNGDLLAVEFNTDFDSPVLMLQQLQTDVGRALTLPDDQIDGAGVFNLNGNRMAGLGPAINPFDVPTLAQVSGLIGIPGGTYLAAGAGAIARTYQEKARDLINAKDFGVVANGVTNDTTALQLAINYCATNEAELILPPGDMLVGALTIPNGGALYMRGSEAGTQGTRLKTTTNAPILKVSGTTQQATIENIGFIGDFSPGKPLQVGLALDNCSNGNVRHCVFDSLYDSITLKDTVFYCQITDSRFFGVVRSHMRGTGVTAPGYALRVAGCQMSAPTSPAPPSGDLLYFENAGSLVFSDVGISPATGAGRCLRIVSNATLSGIHQFDNCVFEGSALEAVRIEGASGAPIKYVYFSNCYFNQNGAGVDAVTLVYVDGIHFVNSYFSGTGAAMTFGGDVKRVNVVNADLPGGGSTAMFRALAGATLDGLTLANINYTGIQRLFDASLITTGNMLRVTISGGTLGNHATPLVINPANAPQITCTSVGNKQTRNGGIAQFNGGVSLFNIPHGLLGTPSRVSVLSNSLDAGTAEIREATVNVNTIDVQCKGGAAAGTNNVKWLWTAEL